MLPTQIFDSWVVNFKRKTEDKLEIGNGHIKTVQKVTCSLLLQPQHSRREEEELTMPAEDEEELNTKLFLRIHAANLPRHGMLKSLPDTYAVVTSVSGRASRSGPEKSPSNNGNNDNAMRTVEWGRTEIVYKNTHPEWTKTFTLNYEYGSECYFYVQVFRLNHGEEAVSFGNAVCEIGDILGSKNHTKVKRLPKGGVVFCRLEPIQEANRNTVLRFQLAASNLDVGRKARGLFSGAPDTIFQMAKRHSNASRLAWVTVYRSSPVQESIDPTWDVGEMDLESCCNGDLDRPLRLSVVLHRKNGQDIPFAECETTLRMILNTQRDLNEDEAEEDQTKNGFQLVRSMNKPNKLVGRLRISLAQLVDAETDTVIRQDVDYGSSSGNKPFDIHMSLGEMSRVSDDPYTIDIATLPTPMEAPATFQEYVNDGCLLDFSVAIDFTSSNGDPRIPSTLHAQSSSTLNDYEETIVAIGNAIAVYSDQFAVWGFGAKFDGVTRHLFQCGPDAQVQGVEGILRAYKSIFESDLTMSGPTLFDQVIQAAAVRAKHYHERKNPQRYCILLIITDGSTQQIEETKRKLSVYSSVPLSVIFVGVGRAEYKSMYELCDSDAGTTRCTTTFVEFRQHQHHPTSLGRAALAQIPNQLVEYMIQNGIRPSTSRCSGSPEVAGQNLTSGSNSHTEAD